MLMDIEYRVSLFKGKYTAYHNTNKNKGTITIYLTNLETKDKSFELIVSEMVFLFLLERVCVERGRNNIRMKNRCNPCKMENIAWKMYSILCEFNQFSG